MTDGRSGHWHSTSHAFNSRCRSAVSNIHSGYILRYRQSLAPAVVDVVLPVPLPVSLEITSLSLRSADILVADVVSAADLTLEPSFISPSSRAAPPPTPLVFSETFSLGCG